MSRGLCLRLEQGTWQAAQCSQGGRGGGVILVPTQPPEPTTGSGDAGGSVHGRVGLLPGPRLTSQPVSIPGSMALRPGECCLPSGWLLAPTGLLASHPLRWRRESLACTRPRRGQPEARSPVSLVEETGWTGRPRPGPGPGPARGVYHVLLSLLVGMLILSLRKVKRMRKWKMTSGWGCWFWLSSLRFTRIPLNCPAFGDSTAPRPVTAACTGVTVRTAGTSPGPAGGGGRGLQGKRAGPGGSLKVAWMLYPRGTWQ